MISASNNLLCRAPRCSGKWVVTMILALVASQCVAAEYCAFEVKVITSNGLARPHADVALLEDGPVGSGKTILSTSQTDAGGVARICDAPLRPTSILAGYEGVCGTVIVRNVYPDWPNSIRITIMMTDLPCPGFNPKPSCTLLVRVVDRQRRPVAGAFLAAASIQSTVPTKSDSLGRVYRKLNRNERFEGMVTKDGQRSMPIVASCGDDTEVTVELP